MSDYREYALTELRDQLGQVVKQIEESGRPVVVTRNGEQVAAIVPPAVLQHAMLPPAYFDEELRAQAAAELEQRMRANHTPEQIAEADAWARKALGPDADGTTGGSAHHAA